MITGFEEITSPLTEQELKFLPNFVRCLSNKYGKENAVSSRKIILVYRNAGIKITGPRVRKIINHIRVKCLVKNLVASSKGYYIEPDEKKVKEYIKSLTERERAIRAVRLSLIKQINGSNTI